MTPHWVLFVCRPRAGNRFPREHALPSRADVHRHPTPFACSSLHARGRANEAGGTAMTPGATAALSHGASYGHRARTELPISRGTRTPSPRTMRLTRRARELPRRASVPVREERGRGRKLRRNYQSRSMRSNLIPARYIFVSKPPKNNTRINPNRFCEYFYRFSRYRSRFQKLFILIFRY